MIDVLFNDSHHQYVSEYLSEKVNYLFHFVGHIQP
jgi:hypothetical protein